MSNNLEKKVNNFSFTMLNCQLFRNFAGRSGVIHGKGDAS